MSTTATKERPILFSGAMVRAILSGEKTQTRRVVELKHVLTPEQKRIGFEQCDDPSKFRASTLVKGVPRLTVPTRHPDDCDVPWDDCGGECLYAPYEIGMRLWVRETWRAWAHSDPHIEYRAGGIAFEGDDRCYLASVVTKGKRAELALDGVRTPEPWRPSIHMPRWASRITLEITNVRVERLQEISDRDAFAEGIDSYCRQPLKDRPDGTARGAFRHLWDSINAARGFGWDVNPWCWCIEFKRLEGV